jgi:hypothetical protein
MVAAKKTQRNIMTYSFIFQKKKNIFIFKKLILSFDLILLAE